MKNLLLLHGALATDSIFNSVSALLGNYFKVHTLTFSGHGSNSVCNEPFTTDLFCNDVVSYIENNNLDSVSIFGYSMGGYVALNVALAHPDKVDKIFTLATVFDWSPDKALHESSMLDPDKIELKVPVFAKSLQTLHGESNWRMLVKNTAHFMIHLGDHHLTDRDFAKVNCPVRIAVGDRDKMVNMEASYHVCKALPNGSMLVIPDTPHPFEKVDSGRLVYEIKEFFLGLT